MCLITPQQTSYIATQDIVVYKLIREDLKPAFYRVSSNCDFVYELDKLYETTIYLAGLDKKSAFDNWDEDILDRLYSREWRYKISDELNSYGPGFHSALTRERLLGNGNIFKCIIPAGSEYYVNPSLLLISDKIIIKESIGDYYHYKSPPVIDEETLEYNEDYINIEELFEKKLQHKFIGKYKEIVENGGIFV